VCTTNCPIRAPRDAARAALAIKIIAKLDISERRLPPGRRIGLVWTSARSTLRVSIIPGVYGENAVLRILDKSAVLLDLDRLGFTKKEAEIIRRMAAPSARMFLVAGRPAAAKPLPSTGYCSTIKQFEKKILTVEDPVELPAGRRQPGSDPPEIASSSPGAPGLPPP
jgi:general secretion pathway protein E